MDEKLNDQAIYFEILINKMRPDLLNKTQQVARTDVKLLDENPN